MLAVDHIYIILCRCYSINFQCREGHITLYSKAITCLNYLYVFSLWVYEYSIWQHGWMSVLPSQPFLSFCVCVSRCESVCETCLKRCCLWIVCFWCRWVGVTLKTFPAWLALTLSFTQTCHYILHLRLSVCVSMCWKTQQAEAFLQPNCYPEEKNERARYMGTTTRKTSTYDRFLSDHVHINPSTQTQFQRYLPQNDIHRVQYIKHTMKRQRKWSVFYL